MMNKIKRYWKWILGIIGLLIIISLLALTYIGYIEWTRNKIIIVLLVCGVIVCTIAFYYIYNRWLKGSIAKIKSYPTTKSKQIAKNYLADQGIKLSFPIHRETFIRTGYDADGNRYHVVAGIGTTRVKIVDGEIAESLSGTGKETELGIMIVVVDVQALEVTDVIRNIHDIRKRKIMRELGLSPVRKPILGIKRTEEQPSGIKRTETTAPLGSEELKEEEEST
jgi:hypothetical protein